MTPTTYADKLRSLARTNTAWVLLLVLVMTPALILAVVNNMALTWDGAWYLFTMLNTGQTYIAHDRLIDAPLHMPVIWASQLSDGMRLPLLVFGTVHVVTPIVAILLSWWVVRKQAPSLIVWPVLSIGLMMLPGHANFIAETLKAYMLMWPLLLAVLVGLPSSTIAVFTMVALAIVLLHPAAVLIFLATTAAAFVIAWIRPTERSRLIQAAICLGIVAVLRYTMIVDGYETDGLSLASVRAQWDTSATAHTTLAVLLAFGVGALLIAHRLVGRWNSAFASVMVGMVAVAGVALSMWARDLGAWRMALDFRGPNHIVTLALAGMAFVDTVIATRFSSALPGGFQSVRRLVSLAIAVVFAVVISLQSLAFGAAINDMKNVMETPGEACITTSALMDYPESPLNHWSVGAHSLLYQGYTPTRIVVDRDRCDAVELNGTLFLSGSYIQISSNRYDLLPLAWSLNQQDTCWSNPLPPAQQEIRRRWNTGDADVRVFVREGGEYRISGSLTPGQSIDPITIAINGDAQGTVEAIPTDGGTTFVTSVYLDQGINLVTIDRGEASLTTTEVTQPDGTACRPMS